jgi:hypothetical protein
MAFWIMNVAFVILLVFEDVIDKWKVFIRTYHAMQSHFNILWRRSMRTMILLSLLLVLLAERSYGTPVPPCNGLVVSLHHRDEWRLWIFCTSYLETSSPRLAFMQLGVGGLCAV